MKSKGGETSGDRRNFLKAAGGAAVAFAAVKDTFAQSASSKSAAQKDRGRSAPPDRGLWITWYDLPDAGRDATQPVRARRRGSGGGVRYLDLSGTGIDRL